MKKLSTYLYTLLLCSLLFACRDEVPELGNPPAKGDLEFEITQNPADPNMVILESFTKNVIPLWTTPLGRSTRVKDTVLIPFAGSYKFVYSVQGAGGFVSADTTTLEITTNNLSYVEDPLWTFLTGGVGETKTWLLDINSEGVSKYWNSPMYFSGDVWRWDNTCAVDDGRCWIWEPTWAGNEWIANAADYGTMTFSLQGSPSLTVNHTNSPGRGLENGTYFLDADAKVLTISDAAPLMNNWADGANIDDWSTGYIITLNEDAMQIGYKDKGKDEFIIFNYISEEYSNTWVPEETVDPEPPYEGDANDDLTTNVSTTRTWVVDLDYPYNWHNLGGEPLNEVATVGSDPAGFTFTTWTPPYDEATFAAVSIELTKVGDNDGTYVIETAADMFTGSYTIDAKNNIDFGQSIVFFTVEWLTHATTAENTLRIIAADRDVLGNVTAIWLGQKSTDKDEYLSIHLKSQSGG